MSRKNLLILMLVISNSFAQSGGDFALEKSTIAAGGGQSNGGDFFITGSIGQHDANPTTSSGGDFALNGGFWHQLDTTPKTEIIFKNSFE